MVKLEDDPLWKALQKPLEIPPKLAKSFNVEKEREKIWGESRKPSPSIINTYKIHNNRNKKSIDR